MEGQMQDKSLKRNFSDCKTFSTTKSKMKTFSTEVILQEPLQSFPFLYLQLFFCHSYITSFTVVGCN